MAMWEGQGELLWLKYVVLFLIGPWDVKLAALAVFFLIDLSSGTYAAHHQGKFSSKVFMGRTKKKFFTYMVVVVVLNIMDLIMGLPNTSRNGALFVLIGYEFLSIATNLGRLGHRNVEKLLKGFYEQLMNHEPEEEKEQGDEKKQRGEKDEES